MKKLLHFCLIIAVFAPVIFLACKKEKTCAGCINGNMPPIASAGPDQMITLPTDSIKLDGSASSDPDGKISEWLWKKIEGPASFNIVNTTTAKTVVNNLTAGVYQIELQVTDNGGLSAKDTLQVIVNDPSQPNQPPVANAGADQSIILPTNTILLDGSASTDPDNNITAYAWTKISGPSQFNITNANAVQTQVTFFAVGVYQFELKVTDDKNLSATDTVQITVNDQISTNRPPIAKAGADQTIILPINTVTLYDGGSTDPDNNITAYAWTKISGPSFFNIINANAAQTQVNNLVEGVYQFELKVTDGGGLFSKDTMQVTVNAPIPIETDRDIYVAGYEVNGSGIQVAKYWKNGVVVPLTDGTKHAEASSITVAGSDVYVAGYETNSSNMKVAKYWKNGGAISLTDGTKFAGANSIVVVGSDVYIAGYETNAIKVSVAKYWKNGIAVPLSNGIDYAVATDIAIAGSDVYISGTDGKFAKYWKNGQEFVLNDGTKGAVANAIAVAGSDVYVAGEDTDGGTYEVKYWKNGIAVSLNRWGDNASATSIAVVDGNVHVAGYSDGRGGATGIAKYWKNGQEFGLGDGRTWAEGNSLAIVGTDVYVAGYENGVAKYWKNGQAVSVTNGTKGASAASIVVIKH